MASFDIKSLVLDLFKLGAIKIAPNDKENFKLKSGQLSPIYIDLRVLISDTKLLDQVSYALVSTIKSTKCKFQRICGVPYTALPIAGFMSKLDDSMHMIMRRKEEKNYGTKKLIEGTYVEGDNVLIIEDVLSSGLSILETAIALFRSGLQVTDAFVFMDREQEGSKNLKDFGIQVHSVIKLSEALKFLKQDNRLSENDVIKSISWIQTNPAKLTDECINECKLINYNNNFSQSWLSFKERSELCTNQLARKLFAIMDKKKSNLCLAVDFKSCEKILEFAEKIGPYICILKTHIDILDDFHHHPDFIEKLTGIADSFDFIIFEDRKFSDIGKTVQLQYQKGIFRISEWAHLINAHHVSGPGVVEGLIDGLKKEQLKDRACLLVAEMSSKGNLTTKAYAKEAFKLALKYPNFIIGFISQSKISADPTKIHLTPGVHVGKSGDSFGQQYVSPEVAILQKHADVIIVGSGITQAEDPIQEAVKYQQLGYETYLKKIENNTNMQIV